MFGGEEDVRRFVRQACERLGAPLGELRDDCYRLPVTYLPQPVRERLEAAGLARQPLHLTFRHPAPAGFIVVHRTHPLVAALGDHLVERALAEDLPTLARCGTMATTAVQRRTLLLLFRLRAQIKLQSRTLFAEEAVSVALSGSDPPQLLRGQRFSHPARRRARAQHDTKEEQTYELREALADLQARTAALEGIAQQRAEAVLADHFRLRKALASSNRHLSVEPCLPPDLIGLYVLLPA